MTLPVLYSDNLMDELDESAFEYSMPADAESQIFTLTQSTSEILETQMDLPRLPITQRFPDRFGSSPPPTDNLSDTSMVPASSIFHAKAKVRRSWVWKYGTATQKVQKVGRIWWRCTP